MKRRLIYAIAAAAVLVLFGVYMMFAPMLKGNQTAYVFVDGDDTRDSVSQQLSSVTHWPQRWGVSLMAVLTRYDNHPRTGRYALEKGQGALQFFRALRGGRQTPVELTIPTVRTMEDMAGYISHNLMIDSVEFVKTVKDSAKMSALGVDTANVYCLFVPNTYEIYWNTSLQNFLLRMKRESSAFWNDIRVAKAKSIPLTPHEVCTLASIVDEETANNAEKPAIAGMYINRLKAGMPLQADPTIKFAWHDFALRRIRHGLLDIKSPYNTYRNIGLPPGPIRVASVEGINAVLNYVHHNFMYMCAREDFSGTHNFARTYSEHLANAARYSKALNERGIK